MKQSRILYLDDDSDLLELFSDSIQKWGFQVDIYSDPYRAFEDLQKYASQYEVLLIDYKMPLINGIDFLQMLHMENFFAIQNIVLFSSIANTKHVQEELKNKIPIVKEKIVCIDKDLANLEQLHNYLASRVNRAIP